MLLGSAMAAAAAGPGLAPLPGAAVLLPAALPPTAAAVACRSPAKAVLPAATTEALLPASTGWGQDAAAFLRTHQWDPQTAVWSLKSGVVLPPGVLPREAVLASREAFLRSHRWQDGRGWLLLRFATRNLASQTATQRRLDLQHFAQTHRWDETSARWLPRPVPTRGRTAVAVRVP